MAKKPPLSKKQYVLIHAQMSPKGLVTYDLRQNRLSRPYLPPFVTNRQPFPLCKKNMKLAYPPLRLIRK